MKLVLIESPLAAKTPEGVERNQRYARAAMRDSVLKGEAPFASHLLYAQDGILDDLIHEERELGIAAGLAWGAKAEMTVVYADLGISNGMERGITRAHADGRPVIVRLLKGPWTLNTTP